jgi:hypothetical protein
VQVFTPTSSHDFADTVLGPRLADQRLVLYVEGAPPPSDLDHADGVLGPLIEAGVPLGVWLRRANSCEAVYRELISTMQTANLTRLREAAQEIWISVPAVMAAAGAHDPPPLGSLLVLFYDDPSRVPYDPDELE